MRYEFKGPIPMAGVTVYKYKPDKLFDAPKNMFRGNYYPICNHTSLPAQQYKYYYYSQYALSNAFTIRQFVKLFLRILFKMRQIFHW